MVMTRRSARIISRNTCASMLIAMVLWNNAYAAKAPTEDSLWYYEIGGAEPVSAPANPSVVSVTLGGSAQLGLGYSCGKFDPVAAVTNTLNDIGAGVDNAARSAEMRSGDSGCGPVAWSRKESDQIRAVRSVVVMWTVYVACAYGCVAQRSTTSAIQSSFGKRPPRALCRRSSA